MPDTHIPAPSDLKEKLVFVLSALRDMGEVITGADSFEYSAKYLLRLILGTVGISNGAIYIFLSPKEILRLQTSTITSFEPVTHIPLQTHVSKQIAACQKPLSRDDFLGRFSGLCDADQLLSNHNLAVAMPLAVRQELLGMIVLGNRFMSQPYDAADLEILRLLAQHISLFFYNQKLLKEAQTANFELNLKLLELEQLHNVGLTITQLLPIPDLANEIVARSASILDARYGALFLNRDSQPRLLAAFGFPGAGGEQPQLIHSCLTTDTGFIEGESRALKAQMVVGDHHIGTIVVAGKEGRNQMNQPFKRNDLQLLQSFANQAAIALENARLHQSAIEKERMERELTVAAEIQRNLLPTGAPDVDGLQIAAITRPCRTVGGDFYSYIRLPDNRFAMVLADVSGKGIPAALLVSTFHAALHTLGIHMASPVEWLHPLNNFLLTATPDNKFITAFFMVWDPASRQLTYVCAGHEPGLLIKNDGRIVELTQGGMVLGLVPDIPFETDTVRMEPGDVLCVYTDGFTDVMDEHGERYSLSRFRDDLVRLHASDAPSILQGILESSDSFRNQEPLPDDQTAMILQSI